MIMKIYSTNFLPPFLGESFFKKENFLEEKRLKFFPKVNILLFSLEIVVVETERIPKITKRFAIKISGATLHF